MSSRIIEAKAVISGEDRLSGVLDKVNGKLSQFGKGSKISANMERLNKSLAGTKTQLAAIGKVNAAQAKLDGAKLGLHGAQERANRVSSSLAAARKAEDAAAIAELTQQQRAAQRSVTQATGAVERHSSALRDGRRALNEFGAPITNLVAHERALLETVERTTAAIRKQSKAERDQDRAREAKALRIERRQEGIERRQQRVEQAARTEERRRASAGSDLMQGMGASGRRQLERIESGRRVAEGMSAPARAARERSVREAAERQAEIEHRASRARPQAKADRNLGPLAGAFGAYEAASAYKQAAAFDRRITMIGQTADAGRAEIDGLASSIHDLAQQTATPVDKLAGGLESLVAQGRNLKDSMGFLPSVARTAASSGSEVEDIAKTADSVGTNFEISGRQMQKAFDIMAAGGKAGQFELKDMARYLPSLGPAASAIGFKGEKGLADLVSMLQVMRKGSGTSEEAVSSMNNILAKMESDKTTKGFKELGVDSAAAFAKARKEGRNLVEVFEELVNVALKGDRSKLGEIIDDMEFKRGVQALMSYRGEWQKLSQTLRDTSGGTVARDLVQVTKDSQAGIDRLNNSWARFSQAAQRFADAGGVSSGLGDFGKELESVGAGLERINRAYAEGGFSAVFKEIGKDAAERLKENRKAWLDERGKQEDGRIAELETARDAHRKKLEAEGRPAAEIADAMKIREAEIQRARRRKGAVEQAKEAPALAAPKPLRMGTDPTAPIQGTPGQIGPGVAGFQEAFPLDLNPKKPFPKVTPLPPTRPAGLPRTIDQIDDVLAQGGPAGPGTFTVDRRPMPPRRPVELGGKTIPVEVVSLPDRAEPGARPEGGERGKAAPVGPAIGFRQLYPLDVPPGAAAPQVPPLPAPRPVEASTDRRPLPPPRPVEFGGKTVPVEVVSLPDRAELATKTLPGGADPAKGYPTEFQASRGLLSDLLRGQEKRSEVMPGFGGSQPRTMPDQRLEATVRPDQITARVDSLPPVSGEATVTVDNHHQITVTLNTDMLDAKVNAAANKAVAKIPLSSGGGRPGAVSMPGAASTPGAK